MPETSNVDTAKLLNALVSMRRGDFSVRLPSEWTGANGKIGDTFNEIAEILQKMNGQFERVARVVGQEGKLSQRATPGDAPGVWANMYESINSVINDLVWPTREIGRVIGAVAKGDLLESVSLEIEGRPVAGELLSTAKTVNTMVSQLSSFASEVTRVATEVGTKGKLGGQADAKGLSGTWKDLTDSVNLMTANLTNQIRKITEVTIAIAIGDLSKKITVDAKGEILELKDTINSMNDTLQTFGDQVTKVAREVGVDGKLGGQAIVPGAAGLWKDVTDNVNLMAANLTNQVRNIAMVTTAVAMGDLSRKITVDAKGEILEMKDTINSMNDTLATFGDQVTKVAREVGVDGKLGGQAIVPGVAGLWKDVTDNVNLMTANLTNQVRNIAMVTTAVATGDLSRKITVDAKGEILELKDTINSMNDTLATFGDQVTKVAREVGVDGKLGGQAIVPGVAGLWKDVTDNVNLLAGNLTSHIRSIAEVATAVTKGDLTRSVVVEAKGEVSELKDNVNEMIRNLRETTTAKAEQDWLKTNLNKFTRTLQGQRDVKSVAQLLLSELAPLVSAQHGVFYNMETMDSKPMLKLASTYGYKERKNLAKQWLIGEGLVGQCAYEKQRILLSQVPADYIQITSGLGEATPLNIVVLPVIFEAEVKAVIELASFQRFSDIHLSFVEQLTDSLGIILNNIEATMRTEDLLTQSQSLAGELQSQQEELQQTNEELEDKAKLLADQNREVERKNQEVEDARKSLEEKAEQLALTSKYKSEFLANMSHELRTPLNSLLILSQQLADNPEGNLTDRQVQYSNTIHGAGADLLNLINDILDLSKIESGTVTVDTEDILFTDFSDVVYRMFNPVAESRHVEFNINVDPSLPNTIKSDTKRLQQIIKNLLSNSFKFTEKGSVTFDITEARSGWSRDHENLNKAKTVVAFAVTDTGIGIPPERQKVIFEAFQQADTGTSRKYGGAGLGLAISRELAHLLGGQICLTSEPGEGSTFTLYLPLNFSGSYLNQAETTILSSPSVPPRETEKRVSSPQSKFLTSLEKLRKTEHKAFQDDRDSLKQGDRVALIVEDDQSFAEILMEIARNKGLKVVVALRGEESLLLARELKPIAITLDILLPDIDGWTVLDRLKLDPETRHIPVHIISVEDNRTLGLQRGAFAFLTKPVGREELEEVFVRISDIAKKPDKRILVVEDDDNDSKAIVEMIEGNDVKITVVGTGQKALVALKENKFDCMILDLGLPDMSGLDILKEMEKSPESQQMPVIVYTGKDLTKLQENQLKKMAKRVIVKNVNSPERLLAATSLFLHRTVSRLPEEKRRILEKLYQSDTSLENRKALVVDDDVRNLFAMTSVLENHNMGVVTAENGRQALEILQTNPDFDAILMDIMMPEMDGYETMKAIRKDPRFKSIPIIAVTAKAMKGDREKCLESGASDYISKPVNTDQLVSLLRIWLYK